MLPDDFNGGLSHVLLLDGHIEIINENDNPLFAIFRSEPAFPLLSGHFGLDEFLDLVALGLARVGSYEISESFIVVLLVENVDDMDSLARARGPNQQVVLLLVYVQFQQEVIPDRVDRRDYQFPHVPPQRDAPVRFSLDPVQPTLLVSHVTD